MLSQWEKVKNYCTRSWTNHSCSNTSSFAFLSPLNLLFQREAVWFSAKQQWPGEWDKIITEFLVSLLTICETLGRLFNLSIFRYKIRGKHLFHKLVVKIKWKKKIISNTQERTCHRIISRQKRLSFSFTPGLMNQKENSYLCYLFFFILFKVLHKVSKKNQLTHGSETQNAVTKMHLVKVTGVYTYFYGTTLCSVAQPCLTLCNSMDCSLPGSSVLGILQARILEWVAMLSSRDLPNPRIESRPPTLQVNSLPSEAPGKPLEPF